MGMFFGKYCIYLKFQDGMEGLYMSKEGDFLMTTQNISVAERFITKKALIKYYYDRGLRYGYNENGAYLEEARIYNDGRFFNLSDD